MKTDDINDSVAAEMQQEREIIPVVEERATVTKRLIDRGAVRVSKSVEEYEQTLDAPTVQEEIEIEHVARDKVLKRPAKVRRDGDTLIIPVMEEIVVTEKRLVLVEEIFIRRRKRVVPGTATVTLKRERVDIVDEREGGDYDQASK